MKSCRLNNLIITVEKEGVSRAAKKAYPIQFGTYSEIRTSEYEFHFNLNGEIKFIRGLGPNWPHPSELLKRTDGNDWVFYAVGSAHGNRSVVEWLGEYYLPCLPYASNSIWNFNPFTDSNIMMAYAAWTQLYGTLREIRFDEAPSNIKKFLELVCQNDENLLHERSKKMCSIIGGRVSVLPPDTRHTDYEVIPLIIADGCLYHCDFCCVATRQRFQPRPMDNVLRQIRQLKIFYGPNLKNYRGLFLGNHDALGAGDELIVMAASEAHKTFGFNPHVRRPLLFLFGSVDSLLKAGDELLEELNRLPYYTYINIGLESVDAHTLRNINKPLKVSRIHEAFQKTLEINRDYANIDVSTNFLLGDRFAPAHNQSLTELLCDVPYTVPGKGAVYLSPLADSQKKDDALKSFVEIKKLSKLPAYIYLIQRL